MNELTFEKELKNVFLIEAKEILEEFESALVAIEIRPDDAGIIDKIFRFVHTIKGSSQLAGFLDVGNFAHVLENLLVNVREKKIIVDSLLIDLLLESKDCLEKSISNLIQDHLSITDCSSTKVKIDAMVLGKAIESPTKVTSAPLKPSNSNILKVEIPDSLQQQSSGYDDCTILVCEDEPNILDLICNILQEAGFKTLPAINGKDALAVMAKNKVHVIFTDQNMDIMNGMQFVSEVRKFNIYLPIVFVSGRSDRDNILNYLKLGVMEFIDKPFNDEEIISAAKRARLRSQLSSTIKVISKNSFWLYVNWEKIYPHIKPLTENRDLQREAESFDNHMNSARENTLNLIEIEKKIHKNSG